jgi:hypothetical protein
MNKIIYILSTFILVALFTACDPIVDVQSVGTVITSADQIVATVTPVMDGTLKTNKVKVHCTSPVSCQWTDGVKTYISNDTVMTLFVKGDIAIKLSAMAADGTIFTKDFTTTVEKMKYDVEPQYGYLCGNGSKTWVWATDNTTCGPRIWGNGGNTDKYPSWWGRSAADAADDNIDINGSMTFTLNGLLFSRTESGATTTGTFSFDMTTKKYSQCIGQITFKGTTILHGISQNDGKKVVYVFNIIKLTDDEMVLMYATESNTYEGWFWMFKRQGYSY